MGREAGAEPLVPESGSRELGQVGSAVGAWVVLLFTENSIMPRASLETGSVALRAASLTPRIKPKRAVLKTTPTCPMPETRVGRPCSAICPDGLIDELVDVAEQLTGTATAPDAPLMSTGLDSMGSVELLMRLDGRLSTQLPTTALFDHPSLRSVASSLKGDRGAFSAVSGQMAPSMIWHGVAGQVSVARVDARSVADAIASSLFEAAGTSLAADASMMAAGLDSMGAAEFANTLRTRLATAVP